MNIYFFCLLYCTCNVVQHLLFLSKYTHLITGFDVYYIMMQYLLITTIINNFNIIIATNQHTSFDDFKMYQQV